MAERDAGADEGVITRRTAMLAAGGLSVFSVLASRLYYLQVVKAEDYRALSDDNRFNFNITIPSRGRILDRYGENLAINSQDYRVVMIPERVKDIDATLKRVSQILPLQVKTLERIRKDIKDHAGFVPILIDDHLDWKTFSALNLNTPDYRESFPRSVRDGHIRTMEFSPIRWVMSGELTLRTFKTTKILCCGNPPSELGKQALRQPLTRYCGGRPGS